MIMTKNGDIIDYETFNDIVRAAFVETFSQNCRTEKRDKDAMFKTLKAFADATGRSCFKTETMIGVLKWFLGTQKAAETYLKYWYDEFAGEIICVDEKKADRARTAGLGCLCSLDAMCQIKSRIYLDEETGTIKETAVDYVKFTRELGKDISEADIRKIFQYAYTKGREDEKMKMLLEIDRVQE